MAKNRHDKAAELLNRIKWHIDRRKYRLSEHWIERQKHRYPSLPDIIFVLLSGVHEEKMTTFSIKFQTWNYAIRGMSLDGTAIQVVVAFEKDMVIITAIRLTKR